MKRFWILSLLFLLFSRSIGAESILTPEGFAGKAWRGTFALYGTRKDKTHFLCTAEAIAKTSDGYRLLTAGHCVQKISADIQFSVSEEIKGARTPVSLVKAHESGPDDLIDFATFDLKTSKKYPVFELDLQNNIRVGDKTVNPHFALGIGKQLSYGQIASQPIVKSEECSEDGCLGNFLVEESAGAGASGSAVFSLKTHKVIGILVFEFEDGIIGFAVEPISRYQDFLAAPVQPHPAPEDED